MKHETFHYKSLQDIAERAAELNAYLPLSEDVGALLSPFELAGRRIDNHIAFQAMEGTEGTEELKKEIQNYVKEKTAPYKYPRIVEFRTELPKTISGKIIRKEL